MKKEIYGCACCSPEFGEIFRGNEKVSKLSIMSRSETAMGQSYGFIGKKLDRRTFLKQSGVAAGGIAALGSLPLAAAAGICAIGTSSDCSMWQIANSQGSRTSSRKAPS